jgi:hypothetical protein
MRKALLFEEVVLEFRGPAMPSRDVQKLHKKLNSLNWRNLLKETLKEFPKLKVINTSSGTPR